jgi:SAM (Sterile alpha motif) domain-containing protein
MDGLSAWLQTLGLERYARLFAENGVNFEALRLLDESDLEKLGLLLEHAVGGGCCRLGQGGGLPQIHR